MNCVRVGGHYMRWGSCTDRAQLAWRMLQTSQPCSPPRMYRSPHPEGSLGERSGYGPRGCQICERDGHTHALRRWKKRLENVHFARRVRHVKRVFVCYLPLGRSESSFLQRTVGTGSPWTTQWNSTLSSASTTALLGRFTKVGRSG